MATRTDSIHSFQSSSPTKYSAGPADEVEELLAQAQSIVSLDPQVEAFITANRNDFFTTFARQVNLIRSRSQAFQDCHVTVFDKVLLELTSNGTHLENAAAVHYFCEEFLAVPINTSGVYKTSILSSAIAASALNFPVVTPPNTYQGHTSVKDRSPEPVEEGRLHSHDLERDQAFLIDLARNVSPTMERLWSVYCQAKRDFQADVGQDDKKQHNVAKFLRDTAENILQYLEADRDTDRRLIDELESSLRVAEEAVTILHGGKKRKFDGQRNEELEGSAPARRAPTGRRNEEQEIRRYAQVRQASFIEPVRGDFPGHTQALIQHQRSAPTPNRRNDRSRRNAVTELFHDEREPKRKRKNNTPQPQPGRGHSNIPFGYSREVDSYQPGR